MNASTSIDLGALPALAGGIAPGARGLSPFRRLLAAVWTEQAQQLAALAIGLGLKREQADDTLQDVYVMAIDRPPPIDDAGDLKRWLFRVTVNRCHLEHRRKNRWRRLWSTLKGTLGTRPVLRARRLPQPLAQQIRLPIPLQHPPRGQL